MNIHTILLAAAMAFTVPAFTSGKDLLSAQEGYNAALFAFQKHDWSDVKDHGKKVIGDFPASPFLADLYFYVGSAYFHEQDYDSANFYFSEFLKKYASPKYFEEAIVYKFQIAEKFQRGAGKHLFGWERMPQWLSAWEEAYVIYDEVITTLPRHEVAAKALFNKGEMLSYEGRFKEAIESYQTLIRRFPKHYLAPDSYVEISRVYLKESQELFPDRDFLEQARLNYKRFCLDFPGENRIGEVQVMMGEMQDRYAKDLWDSAEYFDKKNKLQSSVLYYTSIIRKYPESKYANLAMERIHALKITHPSEVGDINEMVTASAR